MAAALFIACVLGALALVPVEAIALGAGPSLWSVTAALLAALGAVCGAVIAAADALARAVCPPDHRAGRMRPLIASAIRAAAAAPALVLVSRGLFDGGFAATLPGARTAHLWLPLVGCAALAVALSIGRRMVAGPAGEASPHAADPHAGDRTRRFGRRAAVAAALVAVAAAVDYANRTLYRSEYPDVHAFLVAAAACALGLAVFVAAAPLSRAPRRRRAAVAAITCAAVTAAAIAALARGLSDPDDRWAVATRGTHARHLARIVRAALDADGDGYAAVLGGGDCDDGDPTINPAAVDTPGDGVDQDCDGVDLARSPAIAVGGAPVSRADYRAALSAWRTQPEVRTAVDQARRMNVALIIVDALRADALADTPANRQAFPRLFELADASTGFTRAFSPAAGTDVALAALLTGRYAPFAPIDATLLEAVAAAGRRTHAVLPREVVRWAGQDLLTRGLSGWDRLITDSQQADVGRDATGHETTRLGLAFVDRAVRQPDSPPWLLWLHYFDVHEHHQLSDDDPRLAEALAQVAATADPARVHKYRATVALVDAEVGRVIDGLRERGLWDRTIVVLMSDHGEGLGEDPRLPDAHGRFLYNALVRVPLVIRVPGVTTPGSRVHHPVSVVDVSATLLDLTGAGPFGAARDAAPDTPDAPNTPATGAAQVDADADADAAPAPADGPHAPPDAAPGAAAVAAPARAADAPSDTAPHAAGDGRSLLPYLVAGAPDAITGYAPPIALHESDQHGVIAWPYKLLVRPADNLVEVYDIAQDPAEVQDLSRRDRALTARLMALYKRLPAAPVDRSRRARLDRERMFRRRR